MKKILLVLATLAGLLLVGAPTAANAVETPTYASYTLTAWVVGDLDDVWATPQTLQTSIVTTEPSLNQLDDSLPCGQDYQIDRYWTDDTTAALLAGGVLYGPSNPAESLAYLDDGNPWKYLTTEACLTEAPVLPPTYADECGVANDVISMPTDTEAVSYSSGVKDDGTLTVEAAMMPGYAPIPDTALYWEFAPFTDVPCETSTPTPTPSDSAAPIPAPAAVPTLAETGFDAPLWLFLFVGLAILTGAGLILIPRIGSPRLGRKNDR